MTSPPVDRTVSILNLLAAHPETEFSLSEIASSLGIARATAHAIVTTLASHGYLTRNPQVTYTLGPALIPLGTGARKQFSPLTFVVREMQSLADRFRLDAYATAIVDDEIIVVEHVKAPGGFGYGVTPGYRSRLRPPMGITHLAWADQPEIDRWLANSGIEWSPDQLKSIVGMLEFVRHNGYLAGHVKWHKLPSIDYVLAEPATEGSAAPRFNHISAPVFDIDSKAWVAIMLLGTDDQMAEIGVTSLAAELIAAAGRATESSNGRAPASSAS